MAHDPIVVANCLHMLANCAGSRELQTQSVSTALATAVRALHGHGVAHADVCAGAMCLLGAVMRQQEQSVYSALKDSLLQLLAAHAHNVAVVDGAFRLLTALVASTDDLIGPLCSTLPYVRMALREYGTNDVIVTGAIHFLSSMARPTDARPQLLDYVSAVKAVAKRFRSDPVIERYCSMFTTSTSSGSAGV
jgi:hypothetical protein